jgi:hypothetical protein
MSDGFMDFTFGSGDNNVGSGNNKRFKAEKDRTYRTTFVWFTDYNDDGSPAEGANVKFTGCERVYKQGVGYVLITNSNRQAMLDLLKAKPKQQIATVICVWPTDRDGELDVREYKNGKGWKVMPWTFSPDKYLNIGKSNKRFPLMSHDLSLSCSDAQFQKMTFTPEGENLLLKYLNAKDESLQNVGRQIIAQARQVSENLQSDLARPLTVDEVREKLGEDIASPTGSHTSSDVDALLDDVL